MMRDYEVIKVLTNQLACDTPIGSVTSESPVSVDQLGVYRGFTGLSDVTDLIGVSQASWFVKTLVQTLHNHWPFLKSLY